MTQPLNILTSRHGNSRCNGRRRTGFHGGTRCEEQTMSLERFCPQTSIWTLEWQLVVGRHRSLVKTQSDHHIVRKSLKNVPQSKQPIQSGMVFFNPLHPNISLHILHTVLYTFPTELKRRICLTITSFNLELVIPSFILVCDSEVILLGDLSCQSLLEDKYRKKVDS